MERAAPPKPPPSQEQPDQWTTLHIPADATPEQEAEIRKEWKKKNGLTPPARTAIKFGKALRKKKKNAAVPP